MRCRKNRNKIMTKLERIGKKGEGGNTYTLKKNKKYLDSGKSEIIEIKCGDQGVRGMGREVGLKKV